jgi:hypothetical protein
MKQLTASVVSFSILMLAACGGDTDSGGARGGAGRGAASPDAGDSSKAEKTIQCGSKICKLPADSLYDPCCRDQFASECGMHIGEGDECQRERAEVDKRCPLPDFPGLPDAGMDEVSGGLSPCCSASNECGLDVGLGTGCMRNRSACVLFPEELRDRLAFTTCDGEPVDIPQECTPGASTQ